MTVIRTMNAVVLASALLTIGGAAAAQECRAPAFETIQPSHVTTSGTPVRVTNLMRIALPGKLESVAFDPQSFAARLVGGGNLLLDLDDASVAHRNSGVAGKAGPLLHGMLNGASAEGCTLLPTFKLDQQDYRVKFVRGTLSVYAYGTGSTHHFFAIHETKADFVVRGLAKNLSRQSFLDLISTIQPPVQE